jgi:hypothetical protein
MSRVSDAAHGVTRYVRLTSMSQGHAAWKRTIERTPSRQRHHLLEGECATEQQRREWRSKSSQEQVSIVRFPGRGRRGRGSPYACSAS